jgi:hypothetical protein
MATKFYLPSSGTASQNPAWSASWYNATGFSAGKFCCCETKANTGLVTKTLTEADVTDRHFAAGMWISRSLAAQTIASGTVITGSVQISEDNAKNNLSLHWIIRLLQSDGTTYRSNVVAFADDATEAYSSLRSVAFTATLGGNVSVTAGDMLVIELGVGGDPASGGGSHNSTLRIGETSGGADLEYTDADASTTAIPWINFSQTLVYISAVPADAAHAHTAESPALTQHYVLTVAGASQLQTADTKILGLSLTVANASQLQTSDTPTITYIPASTPITIVGDALVHTTDNTVLVQHNALATQDSSQAHTSDTPVLVQHYVLVVSDPQQLQTSDAPILGVGLIVSDISQLQTSDTVFIGIDLLISDSEQLHTSDIIGLGVGLLVADTTQLHSVDAPVLTAYDPHFDLVVDDVEQLHSSAGTDLIQHNVLEVGVCLHEQTSQNVNIGGIDANAEDTQHLQTSDNIILVQYHVLEISDSTQLQITDGPLLGLNIFVSDIQQLHTSDTCALVQHNLLEVADSAHTLSSDTSILGLSINIDNSEQLHTADFCDLVQHNVLIVSDCLHEQTAQNVNIAGIDATADDTQHLQTVDNVVLVQHYVLELSDVEQLHTSDEFILGLSLAISDASQLQTSDNVEILHHYSILVGDTSQLQTSEEPILTFHAGDATVLEMGDSTHPHTSDNVALIQYNILVVSDSTHLQVTDGVALVQHHILIVADVQHILTSEEIILTAYAPVLEVNSSTHLQTADNVNLVPRYILSIYDGILLHTADSPDIVPHELNALVVSNAEHLHSVDNIGLLTALIIAATNQLHTADNIDLMQYNILDVNNAYQQLFSPAIDMTRFFATEHELIINDELIVNGNIDSVYSKNTNINRIAGVDVSTTRTTGRNLRINKSKTKTYNRE